MTIKQIFDRSRLRLHRNRAAKTIKQHDFLIKLCSEDIMDRLRTMDISAEFILEINAGVGILTQKLTEAYPCCNIIATDISDEMLKLNPAANKISLDDANIALKDIKFDIILSTLSLHNVNDVKDFFVRIANLLKPGGVFLANMFGAGTLNNLRNFLLQAEIRTGCGHGPHVSPFATASDVYRLLQLAEFEFIITDNHKIELEYASPLACMRELRNMGESSILINNSRPLTKAIFQLLDSENFTDHVEIITLTASSKSIKTKFCI